MNIEKIFVIGAGQMGSGIVQVAAQAGYQVIMHDIIPEFIERGLNIIASNLTKDVAKGKKTAAEQVDILAKITTSTDITSATNADLVIEAASERLEIKLALLEKLSNICPARTIFATNTSSLPITMLAAATDRATRFIGMHFMNPVPVMKLVEIIRGLDTSDEVYEAIRIVGLRMSKQLEICNDGPGFVSNRVLMPMINEAIFCLYEGVGTAAAIDNIMRLGMNHPMGPLALADLIGLDTCLNIMNVLHDGFKDSKYRACPLLTKYVDAGRLGRKSGRGFYSY